MPRSSLLPLFSFVTVFVLATSVLGGDWPQWRGPNRDGISEEKGLLREWPKEGPKPIWQIKSLGAGFSTPSIVGDRIILLGNEGMENEFVQALSTKDGKELWNTRIGKVGLPNQQPSYPATRSTPTVDGDLLYAFSSDGDLACLETASGKIRWQKNVRSDFGGKPGKWAYAESPLVDGDVLICSPGGSDATILAVNKQSGDVIWKSAIPGAEESGYASAGSMVVEGKKQYVQFLGKGLVGVDAKSGKFLWRYDRTAQGSPANIPSPIIYGDYVYSASGRTGGGLVKVKASDNGTEAEQIYFEPKLPTSIGGAVRIGNNLYGTTGQALICADFKTGAVKWQDRSVGPGSLCYADGLLYIHGENGEIALVEATPEGYREKGRFTPSAQPDRAKTKAWAYPVIANGRLYIRDLQSLWAYDIKGP
jgi:outer membrane protein assembly factor BamB